jgi:hypothetical protein
LDPVPVYPPTVTGERIIGQRGVIGLLTFFATPFVLLAVPGDIFVSFEVAMLVGISMLFADRSRTAGVGLLSGTVATFGALLLLAAMMGAVD